MVDSNKFCAERILKIYGETAFYSWVLTAIMIPLTEVSFTVICRSILPYWGRPMWFAAAYINLLLFSPFLKHLQEWSVNRLRALTVVIVVCICGNACTVVGVRQDGQVINTCWFVLVYVVMAWYKKEDAGRKLSRYKHLFLWMGMLIYVILCIGKWMSSFMSGSFGEIVNQLSTKFLTELVTLPNFICAFSIFLFFEQLPMRPDKKINMVASAAFGVYLIHATPAFANYLWDNILHSDLWYGTGHSILIVTLSTVIVYMGGFCIDIFRQKMIEPKWMKSRLCIYLCRKLNRLLMREN